MTVEKLGNGTSGFREGQENTTSAGAGFAKCPEVMRKELGVYFRQITCRDCPPYMKIACPMQK